MTTQNLLSLKQTLCQAEIRYNCAKTILDTGSGTEHIIAHQELKEARKAYQISCQEYVDNLIANGEIV